MRIAIVHSFYDSRTPSGENQSVLDEVSALQAGGHEVSLVDVRTDSRRKRPLHGARVALELIGGRAVEPWQGIAAGGYDVVRVHNTFPNISTIEFGELARRTPVMRVVHNYRAYCSAGTLSRPGAPYCTDCVTKSWTEAIRHRCYRDSAIATLPVAISRLGSADPLLTRSDTITVLTETMRHTYETFGVPREKLRVIPNFLPDRMTAQTVHAAALRKFSFLAIGRFTPEKGLLPLVKAWPSDVALDIVGDGPQRAEIADASRGKLVRLHGSLPRREVVSMLQRSRTLVIPSICREGLPLAYIEALSTGTSILSSDMTDVQWLVRREGTGMVFQFGSIESTLAELAPIDLSDHCRSVFEQSYSEGAWLANVEKAAADVKHSRLMPPDVSLH